MPDKKAYRCVFDYPVNGKAGDLELQMMLNSSISLAFSRESLPKMENPE